LLYFENLDYNYLIGLKHSATNVNSQSGSYHRCVEGTERF